MRSHPHLTMAPLKGITDALFRRVFCRHFSGLDDAVAPFINSQQAAPISDKPLADLHPDPSCSLPVIPQLLNTDAPGFLGLADRLFEMGYQEINWNLGCPVRMVTKKRRGSGLLPYPDAIIELLDTIMPHLKPRLSIKMRLGFDDYRQSEQLLPRLDAFPLSSITIHARLGKQLYRGPTAPERFARCCELSRHHLVYNGDITTRDIYEGLARQFPTINGWMIGRGLLGNPFLPAEIKGIDISPQIRHNTLVAFHDDLFAALSERLSGPGHLLGKLKQIWVYFIAAFPQQQQFFKKIIRSGHIDSYRQAVQQVFERHEGSSVHQHGIFRKGHNSP